MAKFFENCFGQQIWRQQRCRTNGNVENNVNMLNCIVSQSIFISIGERPIQKTREIIKRVELVNIVAMEQRCKNVMNTVASGNQKK